MSLMVTGGIRRRAVAQAVIDSGVAMAGIATAIAIRPDLPNRWRQGGDDAPALKPITWKNKPLASSAHMSAVRYQLARLSHGRCTNAKVSPLWALITAQVEAKRQAKQYRRWIADRAA